ncbi:MAG: hypothetical protein Q8909_05395 [Bacteroidota bacterium]|uniref:hypothetical protein n=1 Tax=Parabacteroides sp. FAFU027 TaxID=2922715 RepID=UPI001FAF5295|nr:hypothetical protein [Parabacteroides sp. FAFU027]MDP4269542.1 hypothetical protein [Bacteroidota bacterium]
MKNLEDIKKQYGNAQPFKVPENYFEQFNSRMMESLPEKEIKKEEKVPVYSLWNRVKPMFYMAAMLAVAFWSVERLTNDRSGSAPIPVTAGVNEPSNDAVTMKLAMSVDEYSLCEYMSEDQ